MFSLLFLFKFLFVFFAVNCIKYIKFSHFPSKNFLTICLKKGGRWNNLHQSVLSLKPPNSLNRRTLTCYPLIINSICLHAGTNSYSSNRLVIGSIIQDICIG